MWPLLNCVLSILAGHGLQQLFVEWNKSTPDLENNLAGWRDISKDNSSTKLTNCPCYSESWQGVLCLRELQPTERGFFYQLYRVWIVGLALTDAFLTGSLPPAIGNLTSLAFLSLTGNKALKGHLPSELLHLGFNLNILNLRGNGFNGSIPVALASLVQLQQLDLSGNQFDGSLEVDFRNLTWLRSVNLSRNLLTGNIKQEYLQGLKQLITLDLSSNNFTGPLFNLTKSVSLNTLNLSHNSFSGDVSLSNVLGTASKLSLSEVDLSNNALTGSFPDFSIWQNLTQLDLSNNQFQTSPFPDWIKNLTNLQVLRLERNSVTGPIPKTFLQDFKALKIL
ncbi:hypothetical protein M758_UG332100 [Ceratodon purpureus]|nr:hypothetical protein M758_UG332100 [Ceratodon purpureus]